MKTQAFLRDEYSRSLCHIVANGQAIVSVVNMSDTELLEAFIEDLLVFHFWGLDNNETLEINWDELTYFIPEEQKVRLKDKIKGNEVIGLYEVNGDNYFIKTNKEILQASMDFCGAWFGDFKPPEGVEVLFANNGQLDKVIEEHGSIENFANSLATELSMEMESTNKGNGTIN